MGAAVRRARHIAAVYRIRPFQQKELKMPKMKTHSGAKKRFKLTAKGKVKFKRAKMRHIQTKHPQKLKRKLRKSSTLCDADARHVKALLRA